MKKLLVICSILLSLFSTSSFAQADNPETIDRVLSVEEIKDLLVGKKVYMSTGCSISFSKEGKVESTCENSFFKGRYEIGNFNTKGSTFGSTKERFCIFYDSQVTRCSVVYKRKDGSIWQWANSVQIVKTEELN